MADPARVGEVAEAIRLAGPFTLGERIGPRLTLTLETDDVEQSLLRMRLAPLIASDAPLPSLLELTEMARDTVVADVRRFVDLAREREPVVVAYISCIVVHLPDGLDHVVAVEAEVEIDGVIIRLPH